MAQRVTSPHLVGRAAELAQLERALAAAREGRPGLTLVAGESGVGKTRLLAELQSRAAAQGLRVLRGECVALGDGEIAYAPVTGALRSAARAGDPAFDALSPAHRCALARLLPDLGEADPDADRARLFDALLAVLRGLAAPDGLLLVLEDLHWADSVTRDLLRFLASDVTDERLAIVASYRADELDREHPLRRLLAQVGHDAVALAPLTRAELAEQVAAIAGDVGPDALDRLWERAQGNPLFVEELLAAGGGELPPTLGDALLLRTERLSPDAQELLGAIAIGGRVAHPLLAAAVALDGPALRRALREAIDSGAVVVGDDDRYVLRHALLREAVRSRMLPVEAEEVHARFATALEAAGASAAEDLVALANHHAGTREPEAILRSAAAAAEASRRTFRFEDTAQQWRRALSVWYRVAEPATAAGMGYAEVLIRTADAVRRTEGPQPTVELLEQAVRAVDDTAEPLLAARALEKLADQHWALGEVHEAEAAAARAHALLDQTPGPLVQRSTLLATEAMELVRAACWTRALPTARAAREAAHAADDLDSAARAHDALGLSLIATGELRAGLATLRAGVEVASAVGRTDYRSAALPMTRLVSWIALADGLMLAGRLDEAIAEIAEARRAAARHGHESFLLAEEASRLALLAGDAIAAAAALGDPARPSLGVPFADDALARAELALATGDAGLARRHLDAVRPLIGRPFRPWLMTRATVARARLEAHAGDSDAARAAVDETLATLDAQATDRMTPAYLAAAAAFVEADAAVPDHGRLADYAARIASAEALEADRPVEAAQASLVAAVRSGDPADWGAAADAYTEVGRHHDALEARLREARAALTTGDRAGANAVATAVRDRAGATGLVALRDAADRLLERTGPDTAAAPYDLTDREQQVLALLVAGRRNKEIGESLFMAEKTASVHVSRILAKLGVRTRTEAAALALREGLAANGEDPVSGNR